MGLYTYQECKSREINLGLDLKGGMNITLEVSVKDVLVSLSGNNKDTTFRRTLRKAVKNMANSPGKTLVDLFANEFETRIEKKRITKYLYIKEHLFYQRGLLY